MLRLVRVGKNKTTSTSFLSALSATSMVVRRMAVGLGLDFDAGPEHQSSVLLGVSRLAPDRLGETSMAPKHINS